MPFLDEYCQRNHLLFSKILLISEGARNNTTATNVKLVWLWFSRRQY